MFTARTQTLLEGLRSGYKEKNALERFKTNCDAVRDDLVKGESLGSGMAEDVATAEMQSSCQLAFRMLVEEIIFEHSKDFSEKALSEIKVLLALSIRSAEQKYIPSTIPFLMLHDLFESVPVGVCDKIWGMVESHRDDLTKPIFVSEKPSKSSLALLRMCNELMRRLSKSFNTEFCGRVLSFLSYVIRITDRSAVNLHGKFNLANSTEFEAEEEFLAAEAADPDLAEKIAGKGDMMDIVRGEKDPPVDYKLYKTIWGLQQVVSEPIKSTKDIASWKIMLANIGTILTAFEGAAFSEEDLARARDKRAQAAAPEVASAAAHADAGGHFFQPKYLSASRLLRLQRKDPQFRQHVLSQILIMFNYLKSSKALSAKVKPANDDMLPKLEQRIHVLLAKTPPDGPEFVKLVRHVLRREENWKQWKATKCQSFVKTTVEEAAEESAEETRKRLMSGGLGGRGSAKRSKAEVEKELSKAKIEYRKQDNMSVLGDLKYAYEPDMDKFLEDMEMAMDPENGIEDAYHPKNDKVFCWRLRRLFAKSKFEIMMDSSDGNMEPAVQTYCIARDGKDSLFAKLKKKEEKQRKEKELAQKDNKAVDDAEADQVKDEKNEKDEKAKKEKKQEAKKEVKKEADSEAVKK